MGDSHLLICPNLTATINNKPRSFNEQTKFEQFEAHTFAIRMDKNADHNFVYP